MSIGVLIAAESAKDLGSIIDTINSDPELQFVGAVNGTAALLALAEKTSPSVIIIRLDSVTTEWLDAVSLLVKERQGVGIVVMSLRSEKADVLSLLKAGCHSILPYLPRSLDDVRVAIRESIQGRLFVPARQKNGD